MTAAVALHTCVGEIVDLPVHRWLADPAPEEEALLDRAVAPVLDIGCGPGRLVLALARRGATDVIIADIGMPGMSGYDLAQSVRGDPALKHVRLIALTGYGRDEDHARVVAAGFDLHLTKPVADDALQTALNQLSASSVTPRA